MNPALQKLLNLKEEGKTLEDILLSSVNTITGFADDIEWNTLKIDYHPPVVHRLWVQMGTMRLMLHKIFPSSEKVLFHPHPWPSAVYICNGKYEMGVGYGKTAEPPPVAAKVIMTKGSHYTMTHKNGWHYVNPIGSPSLSIMLIDTPWDEPHPFYTEGDRVRLEGLNKEEVEDILQEVWSF